MSKAFTRENDDFEDETAFAKAALPAGVRNYMTPDGAERLRKELAALGERLQECGANGESEQLRRIKARIAALKDKLAGAEVVAISQDETGEVRFGMYVTIRDRSGMEDEYRLVGVHEVDLDPGWISRLSPLAKAILGKKIGETVRFQAPAGEKELQILRLRLPPASGQDARVVV